MIRPVILAGGSGTRLWPLSRASYPKQFLNIAGEQTMLQNTANRLQRIETMKSITVCKAEHRFIVAEQLEKIAFSSDIILEPEARNTAPAVALAAFSAIKDGNDPLLLVLAADHIIQDVSAFERSVNSAESFAKKGKLVTFGTVPNQPETGYGYIRRGNELFDKNEEVGVFDVAEFVEKPVKQRAEEYLKSGEYYWNCGMFMFRASHYLRELKKHAPGIYDCCLMSVKNAIEDLDFIRVQKVDFSDCPADSVDCAILEKTEDAVVVTLGTSWSDIGSWSAIWEECNKDLNGNALLTDSIVKDSSNCLVRADNKTVAIIGIKDAIIVDTKDALLVANIERDQEVKELVQELKGLGKKIAGSSGLVHRPWGHYEILISRDNHQIKRVTVNPSKKISMQKHFKRAEHWVVISGIATVICGDKKFKITQNESTYIPIQKLHRLENNERDVLELIEVQTGDYFGEDDIERFDDDYGRI